MRIFCASITSLIYKCHVNTLGCRYGKVILIGTDTLLEGKQVTLGECVRFGNDGDEVDACTEALHDLDVERFETKTGSDET
jgi:hypothetical protein